MTDLYSRCRNCGVGFSAAAALGVDGTMSERVRSHEAGCPGDVPVSPPAGLDAAIASIAAVAPRIAAGYRRIEDARAVAGVKPGEPLLGLFGEKPYGVKTNGVQP